MPPSKQITFLSHWFSDLSEARVESLDVQGGFSGAAIWRVSMPGRDLCLRRWPQAHPTTKGLQAMHGLLQHVAQAGNHQVSVPLPTRDGDTFYIDTDHLWELTPWMPGQADFCATASPAKLVAAMQALASFHCQACTYSFQENGPQIACSPGLEQRLNLLHMLQGGELDRLWKATRAAEANDLRDVAFELLKGIVRSLDRVSKELEPLVAVPLPLQWCLRDIRHDHLLFTGDQVTGLIDFGAVAVESVSGDVARLLGSMVNDTVEIWNTGIAAYSNVRQLSQAERAAIAGFDEGGALSSAANWVRWIFVEGRSFPHVHALHDQLVWLRTRLHAIAECRSASSRWDTTWKPTRHARPVAQGVESRWMHT
ncbi:MAG: aminoglycoside phosphotransferase family protein [Pirellulales bacterium]|nr:aminoglycoside phosphotransferase family protein [Pirellulales bacterium]